MNTLTPSQTAAPWSCERGGLCLLRRWTAALAEAVRAWHRRGRLAAELDRLDDRELAEIGLQRSDIGMLAKGHPVPALDRWAVRR